MADKIPNKPNIAMSIQLQFIFTYIPMQCASQESHIYKFFISQDNDNDLFKNKNPFINT